MGYDDDQDDIVDSAGTLCNAAMFVINLAGARISLGRQFAGA